MVKVPEAGEKIRWADPKQGSREGVVVSTRVTPRTGKVWVQVQCIPSKKGDYAGQKSVRASQIEVKE